MRLKIGIASRSIDHNERDGNNLSKFLYDCMTDSRTECVPVQHIDLWPNFCAVFFWFGYFYFLCFRCIANILCMHWKLTKYVHERSTVKWILFWNCSNFVGTFLKYEFVWIAWQSSHKIPTWNFSWFNYKTNNAHFSFDIYMYCEKEMGGASTTEEDREEKIEKKITSIHSQLDERKKKMQQLHKIRSEFCSLRNMVEESCQKWRDKTTNFTFRFKDWLVLLLLPQNPFVFYNRSDHDFLRDFTCPHTINVCSMDEKSVGLKIPRKIVL